MGWKATSGGGSHHGDLTGLPDNHHPQYLLGTLGGQGTVNVVAASGSSVTLDLVDGNDHDVTLTANCTIALAGAVNGVSCYMSIHLRQDGTGGRTVTWPAEVEWVGGATPSLQSDPDTWDRIVLVTYDGGTTWYGLHAVLGAGAGSLDALSDVTLTTPVQYDRLHFDGSQWVNTSLIWKPLLDGEGAIVTNGDGDPTMGLAPP